METNKAISGNTSFLQQFAIGKKKKHLVINDRAITYNRCSTEKQDSVEWQSKVTAGLVKQNNWQLIKAFGAKESAKTDDRKEFQEMLRFSKKENISHIVFYSYDRFSRSGNLGLIDELRVKGIKVHSATQAVDDETASGRMIQKFYLVIAEMDNEQRRQKVIEGQKNKLRKGEWNISPPVGYEKRYVNGVKQHEHEKKQCFIDEKGKLIRQAFLWKYNENISNVEVIERLKLLGLIVNGSQLTRIFRNPFYCGYITSTLLDVGEIIRGKHEPLISEEIFLSVNGIVNGNPHGWKMSKQNNEMPLKASVRCYKCDKHLTAYSKKGMYVYYKCQNNGCKINISNKKLHQLFANELSKFTIQPQLLPVVKQQLEATFTMLHSSETAREKPMKDELTRLKNELDAMELNLATGKLSPELFEKHSNAHKEKISFIETELKKLNQDTSNLSCFLSKTLEIAQNLLKIWQNLDYNGKVRLQKLIYPEGLQYLPEIHAVRTLSVNPIFSAISSFSQILTHETGSKMDQENQIFPQLYLMFPSSNFFWENLLKIHNHIGEIKNSYLDVWENVFYKQINPLTGSTEVTAFNYTSNLTTAMVIQDNINENLFLKSKDHYSGATIHCGR